MSVENIVTIRNLPVNNLAAGLQCQRQLSFCLQWKFPLWGRLVDRDTFQLEFGQQKALSVSKSCIKAVWEKITQQVCGDAVEITRKCRNFSAATGPVWELAARAGWNDPGRASPRMLWGRWEQGNWGRREAGEWHIWAPNGAPNGAPGIPAWVALGDPAWPGWGRGNWVIPAEHPQTPRNGAAALPRRRQGPVNTSLPNSDKWHLLHQH